MSNSQSKVNSGPPIWLWLILVPLTLVVIGGVIVSSIPPDLDEVYAEAKELMRDPNQLEKFESKMAQLAADPDYSDHVKLLRGQLALAQSREPMALKFFSEIPEDSPLAAEAASRSGDAHRRAGDFKKAVASYRRGLEKDTGEGLEARMNLASLYYMAGGVGLAIQELDKNIEIDPSHEPSRTLRARIRIFLEEYALAQEDFEAVLDSPGKFASTAPDFVSEYFKCLMKLDSVEKLRETATAHLGMIPDDAVRGSILCKLGEYRDAMVVLQSAAGPEGPSAATKAAQLELLLAESNLEEASLLAKELTRLVPRDIATMRLIGRVFEATGETAMQKIAEENVDQLVELKSELKAAIDVVSGDITNGPGRAKVAQLFGQLTDFRQMDSWYQVAVMLDPSLNEQYMKARSGEGLPSGPIVPFDEPTEEQKPASEPEKADRTDDDDESKTEKEQGADDAESTDKESGSRTEAGESAEEKAADDKGADSKTSVEENAAEENAAEENAVETGAEEKGSAKQTVKDQSSSETKKPEASEKPAASTSDKAA